MRIKDIFRLTKLEFKIGKKEHLIANIIQIFLVIGILYIAGVFCNIDKIVDSYLYKHNNGIYEFELKNFDDSDKEWLYKKGFCDFWYYEEEIIHAKTDSIKGIWAKKIYALINGKDIWNEETDKIMEIILFGKIITGFLTIILFIQLIINMTNTVDMKMLERNRYRNILFGLGMSKTNIKDIYTIYFLCRRLIIMFIALIVYFILNKITNQYLNDIMKIQSKFAFMGFEDNILLLFIFITSYSICSRRIKLKNEF